MTKRFAVIWWALLTLFILIVYAAGRAEGADPPPAEKGGESVTVTHPLHTSARRPERTACT